MCDNYDQPECRETDLRHGLKWRPGQAHGPPWDLAGHRKCRCPSLVFSPRELEALLLHQMTQVHCVATRQVWAATDKTKQKIRV